MKISRVTMYNAGFSAKTSVKAPANLLSKEDIKKITDAGSKIGGKNDFINITVGNLYKNKKKPPSDVYDVKIKSKIGTVSNEFKSSIIYAKLLPKDFILKKLNQLKK